MKIFRVILLASILALILGCNVEEKDAVNNLSQKISNMPLSWGQEQYIYVFADHDLWKVMGEDIEKNLERYTMTTSEEALFEIKRGDVTKMDDFYKFRNLFFVADISDHQAVASYIKEQFDNDVLDKVKKDGYGFFVKNDLWAREQTVAFLFADGLGQLKTVHSNINDMIYSRYEDALVQRIARKYSHKVSVRGELFEGLPFYVDIPKQYVVYKDWKEKNVISFLYRHYKQEGDKPDKYVTVYYEKSDKNPINQDWLFNKRSKLGWDVYDKDEINAEHVRFSDFNWGKKKGLKMAGRWSNMTYLIGGAFQSFAFWDEATNTAYIVDNSIFFPAGNKLYHLLELEAVSRSIKLK